MIRKKEDQAIEFRCIRGGKGETEQRKIAESVEELYGKGRLFNYMIIQPGNSIGEHTHDGTIVEVGPGDSTFCSDGQFHSLKNTGDVPLEFIALILYS